MFYENLDSLVASLTKPSQNGFKSKLSLEIKKKICILMREAIKKIVEFKPTIDWYNHYINRTKKWQYNRNQKLYPNCCDNRITKFSQIHNFVMKNHKYLLSNIKSMDKTTMTFDFTSNRIVEKEQCKAIQVKSIALKKKKTG